MSCNNTSHGLFRPKKQAQHINLRLRHVVEAHIPIKKLWTNQIGTDEWLHVATAFSRNMEELRALS
jgi:hypothetical protein